MVTMVDEIYDRGYQAARPQMNGGIVSGLTQAVKSALEAFTVLNRIEYGAPWADDRKTRCN